MCSVESWLNNVTIAGDPAVLDALLSSVESDYKYWTRTQVYNTMGARDRERGSWTNEDPSFQGRSGKFVDYKPLPGADKTPIGKAQLKLLTAEGLPVKDLIWDSLIDKDPLRCYAMDFHVCGNLLILHPLPPP